MASDFWANRLRAGTNPPPSTPGAPMPQQVYGQPPQQYYQQPPPAQQGYYAQPDFGRGQQPQQAPVVQPIGFDNQGQPVYAPPGQAPVYDAQGRFLGWQPAIGGQPIPHQAPQGYQPGIGQVPGGPPPELVLPMMDAIAARTLSQYKVRSQDKGLCPQCGGNKFFSRDKSRVLNKITGQFATPAPICDDCGYAGDGFSTEQSGSGANGGIGGQAVKVEGAPQLARGGKSMAQAASLSGQPNLFAAR